MGDDSLLGQIITGLTGQISEGLMGYDREERLGKVDSQFALFKILTNKMKHRTSYSIELLKTKWLLFLSYHCKKISLLLKKLMSRK